MSKLYTVPCHILQGLRKQRCCWSLLLHVFIRENTRSLMTGVNVRISSRCPFDRRRDVSKRVDGSTLLTLTWGFYIGFDMDWANWGVSKMNPFTSWASQAGEVRVVRSCSFWEFELSHEKMTRCFSDQGQHIWIESVKFLVKLSDRWGFEYKYCA